MRDPVTATEIHTRDTKLVFLFKDTRQPNQTGSNKIN